MRAELFVFSRMVFVMKKKGRGRRRQRLGSDFILHLWKEEKKRFVGLCSVHVSET